MADKGRVKLKVVVDNTQSSSDQGSESEGDTGSSSSSSSSENSRSSSVSRSEKGKKDNGDVESDNEGDKSDVKEEDTIVISAADRDQPKALLNNVKIYENKAGSFATGFDPLSEDFKERQEKRVKRFGKNPESDCVMTEEAVEKIYRSLGISLSEKDSEESTVRFDALHIHGVDNMSTGRVFDYFKEFAPTAIEWIDDISCNVVWMDKVTATRALLKLSRDPLDVIETEDNKDDDKIKDDQIIEDVRERPATPEKMEDDDELNLESDDDDAKHNRSTVTAEENQAAKLERSGRQNSTVKEIVEVKGEKMELDESSESDEERDHSHKRQASSLQQTELPGEITSRPLDSPGSPRRRKLSTEESKEDILPGKWRLGIPYPKTKNLYLRFATKDDRKLPGAANRSKYYQKYGNPNFGGMKGLISGSRKRKIYSRQHQNELKEAKKAVEESEWKKGVPETTKFDRHIEEMQEKRSKSVRDRVKSVRQRVESARERFRVYSDSEGSSDELVVDEVELGRLLEPPEAKRKMRMHADDVDERTLSSRLGARNGPPSSIRDRLGFQTSQSSVIDTSEDLRIHVSGDLRNRLVGDLRVRLNNRR